MNQASEGDPAPVPADCTAAPATALDSQRLLAAKKKKDAEKRIRFKAEAQAGEASPPDVAAAAGSVG